MDKTMIGCRIRNGNFKKLAELAPKVGTNTTNLAVTILDEIIPDTTFVRLEPGITNHDMKALSACGILIMYRGTNVYAICLNNWHREILEDLHNEKRPTEAIGN